MSDRYDFAPAVKLATYPRIAVYGSGKTYTALRLAAGFGGVTGLIDTYRGAAALYAPDFAFSLLTMSTFDPRALTYATYAAADQGITTLIVDSASAFWSGAEGMLEQVDRATVAAGPRAGNSAGWSAMRPVERDMLQALAEFPGPLIFTGRVKTEWVVGRDETTGRVGPQRVGTRPDLRDNADDDCDVVLWLEDCGATATVVKTRLPALTGLSLTQPGEHFARQVVSLLAEDAKGDPFNTITTRTYTLDPARTVPELLELAADLDRDGHASMRVLDPPGGAIVTIGELVGRRLGEAVWAWAQEPDRTWDELKTLHHTLKDASLVDVVVRTDTGTRDLSRALRERAAQLPRPEADPAPAATVEAVAA